MGIVLAIAVALAATPAQALVQHPESEWTPDINLGPAPAVVGRWAYAVAPYYNASAVAIGPKDAPTGYLTDYVITVRHQGGGIGNGVNFGNVDYSVYDEFINPTADLRIVRIRNGSGPAALADWAAPYTGTDEATRTDRTAVIGGFGRARGTEYATYYSWAAADNPPVQRWGQNKVESFSDGVTVSSLFGETYKSNVLMASFDDYNIGSYVPYESAVAEYDSGGGWFLPVGSQWKLAGLSAYTGGDYGKSYFSGGGVQGQYPIRISSYANWIDAVFKRSTWQSTTGGWAEAANWSAGVPSGVDKFAVFVNTLSDSRTVTVSAISRFGTIRFDSLGNYTIDSTGPGELVCQATTGAGAIEVYGANGAGSHTITAPIKLTSPLVVNQTSTSALLTLAGPLTTPSGLTAPTGLTKVGGGTLVLSGSNTFNGGLEIQKGTVRVMSAGALGTPSTDPKFGIVGVTLKAAGLDFRTDADLTFAHSVKVTTLTGSTVTSALNVDRLTGGTGRSVTLGTLTADGAVTLNVTSATGCSAAFSGMASFTNLGLSGVATIDTAGADLALTGGVSLASGTLTKSGSNALTLSGTQTYGSGTTLKVSGGTLALNADAGSASAYNLAVNVTGAGAAVNFGSSQHLAALTVGGTSTATLAEGSNKVVATKVFHIDGDSIPTGKFDITDARLVVNYEGANPMPVIRDQIISAFNNFAWNGNGITSGNMTADPYGSYSIGYADNSQLPVPYGPGNPFGDTEDVAPNAILVRYTLIGDIDLNGIINDIDILFLTNNYLSLVPDWFNGDVFGYDGIVDDADVLFQANSYLSTVGQVTGDLGVGLGVGLGGGIGGGIGEFGGAVPEPATMGLLLLGGAVMLARRRRAGFRTWPPFRNR